MLFIYFPQSFSPVGTQFADISSHPTTNDNYVRSTKKCLKNYSLEGKKCDCFLNTVSVFRNHDIDINKIGKYFLLAKTDLL